MPLLLGYACRETSTAASLETTDFCPAGMQQGGSGRAHEVEAGGGGASWEQELHAVPGGQARPRVQRTSEPLQGVFDSVVKCPRDKRLLLHHMSGSQFNLRQRARSAELVICLCCCVHSFAVTGFDCS